MNHEHDRDRWYPQRASLPQRLAWITLGVLMLFLLGLHLAHAQEEPSVTFGASVTNAAGELSTRLTWSTTPAATSCTAAGHPSWSGAKAGSGQLDLPAITLSGSYTLTLACTWEASTQAVLRWSTPTTNTDGSALTKCASQMSTGPCLRSYLILRGASPTVLSDSRTLNDRNATSYTWTGLAVGQHFFAIRAVNGDGVQSELSNIATKTIVATQTRSSSVTLTVNPKPSAVDDLEAE